MISGRNAACRNSNWKSSISNGLPICGPLGIFSFRAAHSRMISASVPAYLLAASSTGAAASGSIHRAAYVASVVPAVQNLKFKHCGHDAIIFHEHDIRKSKGDFAPMRTDRAKREAFHDDLHQIMVDAPVTLIGSVIDKMALIGLYSTPQSSYELALRFCLERLLAFLLKERQEGRRIHVVFECQGKSEDDELGRTFRQIVDGGIRFGNRKHKFESLEFDPKFATKSANSAGLQLADLTARPMAQLRLRPNQCNRTYKVIQAKPEAFKVYP